MSNKKNLTKAKKIRKQLLAASATGLLLVSSTASTSTLLVYAAEKNQPTTTEKNTTNSEITSASSQVASNQSVNPSVVTNQTKTTLRKGTQKAGTQVQNLQSDLNDLYSRYGSGFDNTGLSSEATQSAFAALQQRINDLPNSPQKQALQGQLNSMQAMLQEVQLKTASGKVIAQVDTNPKGTYVCTFAGNVSGNTTIGKIQITQPKYNTFMYLFNKEYKGGTYQDTVSELIGTTKGRGDKLIITTNEMPLAVNSNIHLSNTVSKEYTFKLNSNGKWELSSSSYNMAQNAVNALFNGETPKPENTQEQIDQAKNQVNNLFDGTDKETLLRRITKAQQALDASAGEEAAKVQAATEAVNALFNGETPKPENTQEQINAAKAKVEALKDGDTKTALLAKIQKAQQAFEAGSKEKLTLDPYTLGDEYVTGTTTEDIKKFQLIVNGKTYEPGFKFTSGNKFEVYIGSRVPVGTKEFTLKAFNHAGEQVASQVVQVRAVSLTVDKYNLGDEYMTGSCTGCTTKKFRLTVDGKVYNPGFKLTKGKFEIYVGNKISGSSKVVKLEALDNQDQVLAQQNVTIEKPQLRMDEYIRDNEYMTGTIVGKGIKKFKLVFNGTEIMPGSKITDDNKFEIYVDNKIPVNVTTVKVVGLDEYGKEITSQDVTIQAATLMIDKYVLGDEYMTGTFKGGIKKFKLIVDGKEILPGFKIFNGNKFEVYIGNKITTVSKSVALVCLDKAGNVLVSQQVPVVQPSR